jgi:hypothetical protein
MPRVFSLENNFFFNKSYQHRTHMRACMYMYYILTQFSNKNERSYFIKQLKQYFQLKLFYISIYFNLLVK